MTKSEALELCGLILTLWPNFSLTEKTAETYAEILRDVSLAEARIAIKLIANTDKDPFAPNIAKIREAVFKVKNPNVKTLEERFTAILQLASRYGFEQWAYVKSKLRPDTLRVVQAITWYRFCYEPTENHAFLFREFKEAFENVQDSIKVCETVGDIKSLPASVKKLLGDTINAQH